MIGDSRTCDKCIGLEAIREEKGRSHEQDLLRILDGRILRDQGLLQYPEERFRAVHSARGNSESPTENRTPERTPTSNQHIYILTPRLDLVYT